MRRGSRSRSYDRPTNSKRGERHRSALKLITSMAVTMVVCWVGLMAVRWVFSRDGHSADGLAMVQTMTMVESMLTKSKNRQKTSSD